MRKKRCLVITTLAVYQTKFWLAIAAQLRSRGLDVAFISFDDLSSDMVAEEEYPLLTLRGSDATRIRGAKASHLDKSGVKNLNLMISHERLAFNINSSEQLHLKFLFYFSEVKVFLESLKKSNDVILFQKLGGFIRVLAAFYAARAESVANVFVEPSFFKGRQFFVENSLMPRDIHRYQASKSDLISVSKLIKRIIETKSVVIPDKDNHHYATAIKKIANISNLKKFFFKVIFQIWFGKYFEFGHPFTYARAHVQMLFNSFRNHPYQKKINYDQKYIYFPLHVPGDAALTVRSPEYLDQLSIIDFIVRNIPIGFALLIKEHPAQIGALDGARLRKMLRQYDQLQLIEPSTNNFDIIKNASCVISINSKSGAEALMVNCPVIVLGKAFYTDCEFVHRIENLRDINEKLNEVLNKDTKVPEGEIIKYFSDVWQNSVPGELYNLENQNIEKFTNAILKFVR